MIQSIRFAAVVARWALADLIREAGQTTANCIDSTGAIFLSQKGTRP